MADDHDNSSEEGEEEEETVLKVMPEYEKERLSRIKENRARLEALGLPRLSSSLARRSPNSESKRKERAKRKEDDEDEYRPSNEELGEEENESTSPSEEEEEEYRPASSSRRKPKSKGKKKMSSSAAKVRKSLGLEGKMEEREVLEDDDAALQQAIALSLGSAPECSASGISRVDPSSETIYARDCAKTEAMSMVDTSGKKKRRKTNVNRVQLTEDEVIAYFFSFDEAGKGNITQRDLQRMAITHDFSWTEVEIANMIHSFDSDGDGKLSLEDFRKIVSRCSMLQEST